MTWTTTTTIADQWWPADTWSTDTWTSNEGETHWVTVSPPRVEPREPLELPPEPPPPKAFKRAPRRFGLYGAAKNTGRRSSYGG